MKEKGFQNGILFNHFPKLVFFTTELFSSTSDMVLKTTRFMSRDDSITSDKQVFRNIRNNKLDKEELKKLSLEFLERGERVESEVIKFGINSTDIGGWLAVLSSVTGVKLAYQDILEATQEEKYRELLLYMEFLVEHCRLERSFFIEAKQLGAVDKYFIADKIRTWLKVDSPDLLDGTLLAKVKYIVSMILYWSALFDVFLQLESGDTKNSQILELSLPQLDKSQKLIRSNKVFLEGFKERWCAKNGVTKKKWTRLYCAIAKARVKNDLPIFNVKGEVHDMNVPAPQIKKKLERWRTGYKDSKGKRRISFITVDDLKQYLSILYADYDRYQLEPSMGAIVLIQLWELIQFDLQQQSVSEDEIFKAFSCYPDYIELVKVRFSAFKNDRVLRP